MLIRKQDSSHTIILKLIKSELARQAVENTGNSSVNFVKNFGVSSSGGSGFGGTPTGGSTSANVMQGIVWGIITGNATSVIHKQIVGSGMVYLVDDTPDDQIKIYADIYGDPNYWLCGGL